MNKKCEIKHSLILTLSILLMLSTLAISQEDDGLYVENQIRLKKVDAYLKEFADGDLRIPGSKINTALVSALSKLPEEDFRTITHRDRPTLFLHYYTTTIARFASSTEYVVKEDDPPTFKDGFFIIKLGDALNFAEDTEAIEGVIYHEIAHRILENLKSDRDPCTLEVESNKLVKKWGFEEEFAKAKEAFGAKIKGDSPCHDRFEKNSNE